MADTNQEELDLNNQTQWEAFKSWQFPSTAHTVAIVLLCLLFKGLPIAILMYPFAFLVAKTKYRNLYLAIYILSALVGIPALIALSA